MEVQERKSGKDKGKVRISEFASNTRKDKNCDDGSCLERSDCDSGGEGIAGMENSGGSRGGDTGTGNGAGGNDVRNDGVKHECLTAFGDPGNGGNGNGNGGNGGKKGWIPLAIGAGAAIVLAPAALAVVGFTSSGIAAGSLAAGIMSSAAAANGGGVAAGGLVATCQAIGATGSVVAGGPTVTAGVATAGAGVGALFKKFFGGNDGGKPNDGKPNDGKPNDGQNGQTKNNGQLKSCGQYQYDGKPKPDGSQHKKKAGNDDQFSNIDQFRNDGESKNVGAFKSHGRTPDNGQFKSCHRYQNNVPPENSSPRRSYSKTGNNCECIIDDSQKNDNVSESSAASIVKETTMDSQSEFRDVAEQERKIKRKDPVEHDEDVLDCIEVAKMEICKYK